MKVIVVPSWYPIGEDKLMGIYHKEYTSAIVQQGVEADILYVYRCGIKHPIKYLKEKKYVIENEDGYKVYRIKMLNLEPISYKLHMKLYTHKLKKLYKRYLKDNDKPELIHAEVTLPAGYAACHLGKSIDVPVLVTEHSSNFPQYFKDKNEKYGKYVIENSKYSVVSNLMKKQCESYIKDVEIIPNVIDTNNFKITKKEKNDKLQIACTTAFRIGKGVETLLKSIDVLVNEKDFKDFHLNIIGDGYLMDYYKSTCTKLGIDDYVTFHGRLDKKELSNMLNKNDMFVVCSNYESFCIPGLEALACGLPVVSTKCAGPEEYIDKNCGQFCEVKNPTDMADKIIEVSKKLDKYDKNYMRSIAEKYSYKEVANKAIKIYKELLKR